MPRVSVGMPVYNGENYLEDALKSILAQTFQDFELIISDNCSTDRTEEICRTYAGRDPRIRYFRNDRNCGAGWNHRRVVELSTSEYFKWAAHDDLLAPEFLDKCVEVLDRDPGVALAYPQTMFIDETGAVTGPFEPGTTGFDSPKPYVRFGVRTSRIRPPLPFLGRRAEDASAIFGVVRATALHSIRPFGDYGGSDQIILARLALIGRFHRVPQYLFFNRDHAARSIRAAYGRGGQTLWLLGAAKHRVLFPEWKLFWEFVLSIPQAKLSLYERFRCYIKVGKYFLWNWPRLARDLYRAARQLLVNFTKPNERTPSRRVLHGNVR